MGDGELKPRLCKIKKWDDFPGYGFNLHAERGRAGQYIGKVDDGSPAQAAGMKEGDRIVEVEGTNIGNENHSQVVTRIKAAGESVTMLLVDAETDKKYKEDKIVVSSQMSDVIRLETPPRPGQNEDKDADSEPQSEPPSYNDIQQDDDDARSETPPPPPEPEQDRAPSPDAVTAPTSHNYHPRLCYIKKWPDFQGYGFNLHAEKEKKGQYIGLIDANSPAEDADLRKGDRIIEVNNVNIEDETHQQVIQRIKAGGEETKMLVVDEEADVYYKNNGIRITTDLPEVIFNETRSRDVSEVEASPETLVEEVAPVVEDEPAPVEDEPAPVEDEPAPVEDDEPVPVEDEAAPEPAPEENETVEEQDEESPDVVPDMVPIAECLTPTHNYNPRLCHIRKWPDFQGYGFNMHAEKDRKGQFIGLIDANSPAEDADLRKDDRVIEVNGVNVEDESYQQVIQMIKAGGNETKLLVVDSEADKYYKNNAIQITSDLPEVLERETTPREAEAKIFHPRHCHIIKWPDFQGYGFNLHAEKERGGQYIGKIDDNSPAQEGGLREHDRIIEVNNENIENETHQQVIARIKAGGDETKMLVVDKEADDYYKSRGITVTSSMPEVKNLQTTRRSPRSTVTNGNSAPVSQPPRMFSKKKAPSPPKSPLKSPSRQPTEEELFTMTAQEARNHIHHVHRQKSDKRLSKPDIAQKVNIFEQL